MLLSVHPSAGKAGRAGGRGITAGLGESRTAWSVETVRLFAFYTGPIQSEIKLVNSLEVFQIMPLISINFVNGIAACAGTGSGWLFSA